MPRDRADTAPRRVDGDRIRWLFNNYGIGIGRDCDAPDDEDVADFIEDLRDDFRAEREATAPDPWAPAPYNAIEAPQPSAPQALDGFWFAQGPLIHGPDRGGIDVGPLIGEALTEASAANLVKTHNDLLRSAPQALDVERLARAIHATQCANDQPPCPVDEYDARRLAERYSESSRLPSEEER